MRIWLQQAGYGGLEAWEKFDVSSPFDALEEQKQVVQSRWVLTWEMARSASRRVTLQRAPRIQIRETAWWIPRDV